LLFNSAIFLLCFLPVVLIFYYRLSHKHQNIFLVLASLVFYATWDWRFLAPLLFTTFLDFWVAKKLEESHGDPQRAGERKRYLLISVISNLSLLGFFKYFNFFAQSAQQLGSAMGLDLSIGMLEIVLPLAISFYTFQALSYTIDVYRGELHATSSFWDFFLAVLYFPHLIAGPIQRASWLLPQIINPRTITRDKVLEGIHLIFWGFFKKVFIADNVSPIADQVFGMSSPSGGDVLIGVLAFTVQIYCDFSGYTDIARGLAKIMGFEFTLNFNLPYIATNPSDFWRRWHISLSTWLRDYLYKPLGGNRQSAAMTQRNLMITMVLGGLWHGAAWNFVLWGFYHGALLSIHRWMGPALLRLEGLFAFSPRIWWLVRWSSMFALTCYGWLLFRATSLEQIGQMTSALSEGFAQLNTQSLLTVLAYASPVILVQIIQVWRQNLYFLDHRTVPGTLRVIAYTAMAYMCLFQGGSAQSFVYFQF
jgi:alginate O-acetyltransferase complex protein AlgI